MRLFQIIFNPTSAAELARQLPCPNPLQLTAAQKQLVGEHLAKLLKARVAYHHSGLSYGARAGVIEPLAKAGQLRAVVATLGLSAGINFSLRSVLITASTYRFNQLEHEIEPHELLQMIGRAGRRGFDETGFVLCTGSGPRMRRAQPLRLKRAAPLPWAFILRQLRAGHRASEVARAAADRFFATEPLDLGLDAAAGPASADLPCGQHTATGRARLVRREKNPFLACRACPHREACLALSPQATLLWQWQRLGLLDRVLGLTPRAAPFDLARHDPAAIERDGVVTHPGGLRLLNNLAGSGEIGQITSTDVVAVLDGLLPQGDYVVLSLPLYPVELLRDVAARSNLIAVATPIDPAGLAATRSALGLLDRLGVGSSQIGLILIGAAATPVPDLGREVLATLTTSADSKDPSFAALAVRLHQRSEKPARREGEAI